MPGQKRIKIIKKSERAQQQETKTAKGKGARDAARDMVQTVTNWVNELHQNKRTETAEALKMLLPESPRPSEA